jgi:hypothetical protein
MRTMTYNDEAAPGAGAVISWEPDGSSQMITMKTSSLKPLWEHLD